MNESLKVLETIAPTIAAALKGPFAGVASKFVAVRIDPEMTSSASVSSDLLAGYVNDTENLLKIKSIESEFVSEMLAMKVDVFDLIPKPKVVKAKASIGSNIMPQLVISAIFLLFYFGMLGAILYVETSDTLNMQQGENSLMGELQILFGVLTAGVGQVLSFWFSSRSTRSRDCPKK
jgi:hypothetical protein